MLAAVRAASLAAYLRAASPLTFLSESFGLTVALEFLSCMLLASTCPFQTSVV